MNVIEFTKWRETDSYKKLTINSIVIVHDDLVNVPSLGLNFWAKRDIPDEWLKEDRKNYSSLNIRRMTVSDIIENDDTKYSYIKSILLENEIDKQLVRKFKLNRLCI